MKSEASAIREIIEYDEFIYELRIPIRTFQNHLATWMPENEIPNKIQVVEAVYIPNGKRIGLCYIYEFMGIDVK